MLTRTDFIKTLFLVSALTVIDHIVLTNIDRLMEVYIAGYQARSSYLLTNIMYFIACFITIICGLRFSWSRMLPFIYIAVAVFFPLIFLNSAWEVYIDMAPSAKAYYQNTLCRITAREALCGKALAHMVFTRVISALPLLFMTPVLFYITVKAGYFELAWGGKKTDA